MIINSIDLNYTVIRVPNSLSKFSQLSFAAKGLWCHLAAKGKNWRVYTSVLAKEAATSEKTITKWINELISFGFLTRERRRNTATGKWAGGYDYFLISPENPHAFSTSSVDNLDNNNPDNDLLPKNPPNRRNFPTNVIKTKINNIGNNNDEVGLSGSVDIVDKSSYSALELEAAAAYVDKQKGVRDRAAYLACTLRNGWHHSLVNTLAKKQSSLISSQKLKKAREKYKNLPHNQVYQLKQSINSALAEIPDDQSHQSQVLLPYINVYQTLLSNRETDKIGIKQRDSYSQFLWYCWLISEDVNSLSLVERPLTDEHTAAFLVAKLVEKCHEK